MVQTNIWLEPALCLKLVFMDYLSLELTTDCGNMFTLTEHFTRFSAAVATWSQTTWTTAQAVYEQCGVWHDILQRLHSDQEVNFLSNGIKEL